MLRLIAIAVLAITVTNVTSQLDSGPEDMHFPAVRALNTLIEKYSDSMLTLMAMKMRFATMLSENEEKMAGMNKAIMWRGDVLNKLIEYAGFRGITPDPYTPQAADLSECDMAYGCFKLSLRLERELYKALQDAYSSAGSHEDGDAQAKLAPLFKGQLEAIRYNKAIIAKIAAGQAKKNPVPTDSDDDDSFFDDITLL